MKEQPRVPYSLVLVRGIGLFIELDLRMGGKIVLVIELNGTDKA